MKKILIIGIILILIGGVFCGAAYAVGERYMDSQVVDVSAAYSSDKVNKINITENVANIKFLRSGGGDIIVKAENIAESEFKCLLTEDNILQISYNPRSVKFGFINLPSFIFDWKNKSPVINIYIPEGKIFEEVKFNGGVGSINVEQINAKSLIIGGGVGEYNIKNMITENLRIDGGVGSVKIDGIINGDTKIDGGVGEVKITGQANGNIKLSTGVGSADLDLTGNVGDYNFKVNRGVGSIRLNGSKMPDSIQNGGKYNIDINAGVGSINININGQSAYPEPPESPEPPEVPEPPEFND
ncbi:MAG: DUF4097 domain-containing protein [Oscillospiraceae bacterium]|nr:DUF4097 domain-containing protein [Oscillospiraceae bacterium]